MSIKPFINNESRINSPIALLGSSASYSERTEFPRSLQTEINEERDGATATTYHKRPHDSTSSPTPNSDHEFSTESGYTVSKKGLKTVKPHLSRASSDSDLYVSRTPSPPKAIQAHQQDATSQVVTSLKPYKSYQDIHHDGDSEQMPTLEPALFGGVPLQQQAEAQLSPKTAQLSPGMKLGCELGIKEEDISEYRSREMTVRMKTKKMMWNSPKGNTWNHTITVVVNKKIGVKVQVFLQPKFNDGGGTGTEKPILFIRAEIMPVLRKQLMGCHKQCWIQVDTEVMDTYAGKRLHFVTGRPYPISIDENENQVNFHQDLLSHDQLKSCKSKSVMLTMKVTFITSHIIEENFEISEKDGFFNVEQKKRKI